MAIITIVAFDINAVAGCRVDAAQTNTNAMYYCSVGLQLDARKTNVFRLPVCMVSSLVWDWLCNSLCMYMLCAVPVGRVVDLVALDTCFAGFV